MLYHGTEINRGKKILRTQDMPISMKKENKKDHWLGDGVYFFDGEKFAYRWIYMMFEDDDETTGDLLDLYMILEADVEIDDDRVFSLENEDHNELFWEVREGYVQKHKKLKANSNIEITDGFIINIMFKELSYNNKFDIVKSSFPIKNKPKDNVYTRIRVVPHYQYCVKNKKIIKEIRENNIKEENKEKLNLFSKKYYSPKSVNNKTTRQQNTYKDKLTYNPFKSLSLEKEGK